MKKYVEIVNNEIKICDSIHPFNLRNEENIEIMRRIFIQDISEKYPNASYSYHGKKVIELKLKPTDKKSFVFFLDHVDSGGSRYDEIKPKPLNEYKKRVSIEFANKEFADMVKIHEKIFVVNFYFPLINNEGDTIWNYHEYIYIILGYEETYKASAAFSILEGDHKANSSSRWIKIGDIHDFISSNNNYKLISGKDEYATKFDLFKNISICDFFTDHFQPITGVTHYEELINDISSSSNEFSVFFADLVEIERGTSNKTTKKRLIDARLGQGKYREELLNLYGKKCLLSGIDNGNVLIASHIMPWRESSDSERLDKYNGFLLSANIDKLFDRFYISFDLDGKLVYSQKNVNLSLLRIIGIKEEFFENSIFPFLNKKTISYMSKHYEHFLKKEKNQ